MSNVLSLYSTLASKGVSVTVGEATITPTAYSLERLPDVVEPAMLPCRLLLPMGPRGEGRDFNFIALGKTTTVTWHLTDLMLWRMADTGIGLEDIAAILVGYAGAYAEMLRANRAMGQTQCHIVSARFSYATFRYPDTEFGQLYDGVECSIDIEEALSG